MGNIFDGKYTRLDDDTSFLVVRTNPLLTTNTKVMYDGKKIYLESFDSNPLLSTQRYKNFGVSGSYPYNRDIRSFLIGAGDSAYDVAQNEPDTAICDSYDKQFENTYWCGVESIASKQYTQEFGFVAPLYIRKKLPSYFVIFRVDGPSNHNLTRDNGVVNDDVFSIDNDVMSKAKIVKTFDLRPGSPIGNYIDRYVGQDSFEYDRSIHVNFSSKEITYYGIDKKHGVLTSKTESFRTELLENDNTIIHMDDWITGGFKRNNLIFPYLINFEFLFDDNDTKDYRFSRYFGMYCNDIDLFDFEAGCSGVATAEELCEITKSRVVKGTGMSKIRLTMPNDSVTYSYPFERGDRLSFKYVKDKDNVLHHVADVYENYFEMTDTSVIELFDKSLDLETLGGFERPSVSAKCERLELPGRMRYSFTLNAPLLQGETISFNMNGSEIAYIVAVTEEDDNTLPACTFEGCKFSSTGSLNEIADAMCNCINSIHNRSEARFPFVASHIGTDIVISCSFLGINRFTGADVVPERSVVVNNTITVNGSSFGLPTGAGGDGCVFKVSEDDRAVFSPGRYISTGNRAGGYSKILSVSRLIGEDGMPVPGYCEVVTDENGKNVSISNTGYVEILDRFYPKFGILSMFPVKDFDFDLVFSSYGCDTAFVRECVDLEANSVEGLYAVLGNSDEDYERGSLTSLAEGYLKDSLGKKIDSEYDYFMENLIPELSTCSKSVPYITKWGYYDECKDSCENSYRLNTSKVFGTSNLSSNTFTYLYSIDEHTHSMPYYLTNDISKCGGGNYQYVYDYIGIYNYEGLEGSTLHDSFLERCLGFFMDTETDNFDRLFSKRTGENKRFERKYSRMSFGSSDAFPSTLFRGVMFDIRKLVGGKERKGSEYNGYKFAFIYIPVNIPSIYVSNKVHFVKNDTFRFIIGFVIVNTLSSGVSMPSSDENHIFNTYELSDFCKAYMYGGCYGLLSLPVTYSGNDNLITITNMPIDDVFNIKKEEDSETIEMSQFGVANPSIKLMFDNVDDQGCIKSITIHNLGNTLVHTISVGITYSDGVVTISEEISNTTVYTGGQDMFVDITMSAGYDEDEGRLKAFDDFYSVFESFSTYNIKKNITEDEPGDNGNVSYYSTSGDTYRISIIDPVSINTYDIFEATPQFVENSGVSYPCSSEITLKQNENDISLRTINRYSGFYNPIFNDLLMFDDFVSGGVEHKFSNTRFDTDYRDIYGGFGEIRNMWFHKANDENPERIITMQTPLYPAIGQFALDYRDYNIFESNWDKDYFTKQVNLNEDERCAGTSGIKNGVCMFGSKQMNLPEEITIETLDGSVEWDDDLLAGNPPADMMYKEMNGTSVKFHLFLRRRILRYFTCESGLRSEFEKNVDPENSFGDKTSIDDDIEAYVEKNILGLYELENVRLWVKRVPSGKHDSRIENDYFSFLQYDNEGKVLKRLMKTNTLSMKKTTSDRFDREITYNMRAGEKESFGFSFTIRKI